MSSEPYRVPPGVEIATQWAWRLIVIGAAGYGLLWLLRFFSQVTVPIAIAVLGAALAVGAVDRLERWGIPRLVAALSVTIGMLVAFFGLLTLVGQQLSTQFDELRLQVVAGIDEIQTWAKNGPLQLTDSQISEAIERVQDAIENFGQNGAVDRVASFGTSLTYFVTGFFIALFAAFFFLYQGRRIWAFVVVLFPRDARRKLHSSGLAAWQSLTAFVRATVIVAFIDAVGIGVAAWLLGVPLAFAIAVLVFLLAFIPIVGALLSGFVAVAVALVAQGPLTALFMLLAVIAVQQIESQVLHPFLMGAFVSVHPLGILLAITAGITVSGIFGALISVPIVAALNGVIRHLAETAGAPLEPDGLPERRPPDASTSPETGTETGSASDVDETAAEPGDDGTAPS